MLLPNEKCQCAAGLSKQLLPVVYSKINTAKMLASPRTGIGFVSSDFVIHCFIIEIKYFLLDP